MNTPSSRRRIFIFHPAMNDRTWRVLFKGVMHTFPSEGRAVEFALTCASQVGGSRMAEVVKETASGTWMPVHIPPG